MEDFINRKIETQTLEDNLKSDCKVGVVFSHEGIGKSCFIEHFIRKFFEDKFIIIKNSELDFENNVEKYYFANKICEGILKKTNKNLILKLINQVLHLNVKPSISFSHKWFSLNLEINEKFRLLQELIVKIIKKRNEKLVIYLDNVNKIDYQSVIFISRIIEQTSNIFFILEFTLGKEEQFPTKLIEYLRNNKIIYTCIELKKLSCEHAYQVMRNNNISNINSIINSYNDFDGNLKEVILMNDINVEKNFELDKDEEFILEFINLTKGELSYDEIYKIIHNYPQSNCYFLPLHTINTYIEEMYTDGLVDFNSAKKLYLTLLGKKRVGAHNEFLITEMLANYYIPIIIKDNSEMCLQGLKILLPLLTQKNDARIKKILPSLHKNIVISRCNKDIIDDIYNNIDINSENDYIRAELIKMYICFGDYKTAYDKIQSLCNKPDDTIIVLYATLISHLYSNKETEHKISDLLSKVTSSESRSALLTCLVALYMKIKPSNDVLEYVAGLKKEDDVTTTDLNIINKNISIYYDFDTANTMLNDSLSYFETHNMIKLSIATKITLATRLAQNGYTKEANEKLNDILNTDRISELDYIYATNNICIIKMLENDFRHIKIKDLINNYKYIQDEYTKLLVANNLLVYYCNTNDYKEATKYAEELENVGFIKYKFESYLLLTYLNLKFYYQKIDKSKIPFWDKKLQKLLENCNDNDRQAYIKSMIDGSKLSSENELFFLSKFNYRPAFLGHWIINNFDY